LSVSVQTEFVAKGTVRVRAEVRDDDDELCTPTSIKCTITDAVEEVQVDAKDMTEDAEADDGTGLYDYYYNTTTASEKGWWTAEVVVVDGSGDSAKTSVGRCEFKVKP